MDILRYIPKNLSKEETALLNSAFLMAKEAGEIQMKYFRQSDLKEDIKQNDSDVVTIADKESEKFILDFINHHYPEHGIISEESGMNREDREWRWVIDPLDGTTNFSSGLPVFCVSIALEHFGEAFIGVVYAPYLKECFYSVKGKGSWLNGKKIRCSAKGVLSKAVVATGMPYDRNTNEDNNLKEINRVAMCVRGIRRMGSAAIDLCYTAAGFLDAYWELNLNRWDVSAGELIAKEAGVVIESIRENRNHSLLASNPALYLSFRKVLLGQ